MEETDISSAIVTLIDAAIDFTASTTALAARFPRSHRLLQPLPCCYLSSSSQLLPAARQHFAAFDELIHHLNNKHPRSAERAVQKDDMHGGSAAKTPGKDQEKVPMNKQNNIKSGWVAVKMQNSL
ncbi:hypothetical protein TI39_contig546g00001 [Zymoseptoria brevis]|uniref:Uncharacterized protein n=1 Tax=Zymoseptoria brevis TaxID=1047168 RepID=A0A0F4GJ96_9PEZI|nr:hypothetical protein TI39_contig546g00001 [Zymoseptoria brevis]